MGKKDMNNRKVFQVKQTFFALLCAVPCLTSPAWSETYPAIDPSFATLPMERETAIVLVQSVASKSAKELLKTYGEDEVMKVDSAEVMIDPPAAAAVLSDQPGSQKKSPVAKQKSPQKEEEKNYNARIEALEDENAELRARLEDAKARLASRKASQQEEGRWKYEPVPREHISSLSERLRFVDLLLQHYGRAYDYRTLTRDELRKLLRNLEAHQKPIDQPSTSKAPAEKSGNRSRNT